MSSFIPHPNPKHAITNTSKELAKRASNRVDSYAQKILITHPTIQIEAKKRKKCAA